MKFRKYFINLILILSIAVLASGCSKNLNPKESFDKFISSWQKSDFASMYKLLSSDTRKNVDETYFIDRYKKIYSNAKVSKISIKPDYPQKFQEDKDNKVHFPITVTLDTPIGSEKFTYEVNLVKEKQDKDTVWAIIWDEKMILPDLNKGENAVLTKEAGKRGEIKDRNGQGLAVNKTASTIYIVPQEINADRDNIIKKLADILKMDVSQIESKLNQNWVKANPTQRVPITNVSRDDMSIIYKAIELPGVKSALSSKPLRVYPVKEAAAHLIGYVGNITAEELEKYKDQGYDSNDVIGKTGLESIYEKRLRGEAGGTLNIVDENGNVKQTLLQKQPKDGENITLTIDINLQKDIYAQMGGDMGASVAVDPKTGKVLAMVSSPSYDPNLFVSGISQKQYDALANDPKKPLISRFDKTIVPGSSFKPVTAAIGLKTGKLDANKEVSISGDTWQKDSSWGNYKIKRVSSKDSSVNLLDAFVYSDNIYFAQTALSIGKDDFLKGSKEFGIEEKIPFVFPMGVSEIGALNTEVELADSGYGQGKVLMNPLHLALIYSSFVNGGDILTPVLDTKDQTNSPGIWKKGVVSKDIADTIIKDLIQVVENPNGTAHSAQVPGVTFAGKTGTAELKQSQGESGKENGWFAAVNTDNPKLAIVMVVEDVPNGEGSHHVLPKVQNIMKNLSKY